jgi:hypothetical protein
MTLTSSAGEARDLIGAAFQYAKWQKDCIVHRTKVAACIVRLVGRLLSGTRIPDGISRGSSNASIACRLLWRAAVHDLSKHAWREARWFVMMNARLHGTTYGSKDYNAMLAAIMPGIDLHRRSNRHHPEYHENWLRDMDAVDELEMLCDWLAATEKHADGNIFASLAHNRGRFGYCTRRHAAYKRLVCEMMPRQTAKKKYNEYLDTVLVKFETNGTFPDGCLDEDSRRALGRKRFVVCPVISGRPVGIYHEESIVGFMGRDTATKKANKLSKAWNTRFAVFEICTDDDRINL